MRQYLADVVARGFKSPHFPFYVLTLAVMTGLVLPSLVQDGMFMDGMIYASVAKNFANGMGTWWNLYLSDTLLTSYHDQPPLTLWIESFFFRVLGNGIYTERVYSFTTALVNGWLISVAWRTWHHDRPGIRQLAWLPVLLWIVVPVCFWSFANNMQENTMSIFVLAALVFYLRFSNHGHWHHLVFAGLSLFLASMCKGIQGTFLVAFPVLHAVWIGRPALVKGVVQSAILAAIPLLVYFMLFQDEVIAQSFHDYFRDRLVSTFNDPGVATSGRYYLLGKLLLELAVPAGICVAIFFLFRKQVSGPGYRAAALFAMTGLCGTLPLLVTLEQRGFYLVTTMPLYAMALASLVAPSLAGVFSKPLPTRRQRQWLAGSFAALFVAMVITATQVGKTRRDADMIHDVHTAGSVVPAGSVIGVSAATWQQWSLHMYFARHYNISLDSRSHHHHTYYLVRQDSENPPPGHRPAAEGMRAYQLYRHAGGN